MLPSNLVFTSGGAILDCRVVLEADGANGTTHPSTNELLDTSNFSTFPRRLPLFPWIIIPSRISHIINIFDPSEKKKPEKLKKRDDQGGKMSPDDFYSK